MLGGPKLSAFAWPPRLLTLTRRVWCVLRSCTKMSKRRFVSPRMRLEAAEWKATYRPFALIDGALLPLRERSPAACLPRLLTLTLVVRPVRRSRTKTSARLLVSWATRFEELDV